MDQKGYRRLTGIRRINYERRRGRGRCCVAFTRRATSRLHAVDDNYESNGGPRRGAYARAFDRRPTSHGLLSV